MNANLPPEAAAALLQDAIQRDATTARRAALLRLLLRERYLSREQLIARVEGGLGQGCFGVLAWQDAFYRDMRAVKTALAAAGYQLGYSRSARRSGYYLRGQGRISAALAETIARSLAEPDTAQMTVIARLAPAARFRLGCSVTDTARDVVAYRLRQGNPALTPSEASYLALRGEHP